MKKESGSIKDLKESQRKRAVERDLAYLKPLMLGLKNEEITFKEVDRILLSLKNEIKDSEVLFVSSNKLIFGHFTVKAIIEFFDRNTSYTVRNSESLIGSWFLSYQDIMKKEVLDSSLLILNLFVDDVSKSPLLRVLKEVVNSRVSAGKKTWIFVNSIIKDKVYSELNLKDAYFRMVTYDYKGGTSDE